MTKEEQRRKRQNEYVLRLLREGKTCTTVAPEATWWPPRPIISKNKDDIIRLYKLEELTKEPK